MIGVFRLITIVLTLTIIGCAEKRSQGANEVTNTIQVDDAKILEEANTIMDISPQPLTMFVCPRSAGGPQDFYSEGDYWWPDPDNPDGPYIRRDGQTNPDNFVKHRQAMRNLNYWVATLTAAYKITNDKRYAQHALKHLDAFFIDENTRMNPNLLYAQAIKGRFTGRGIGIIDTIHLIEICKALKLLHSEGVIADTDYTNYQSWFDAYATWMNTHQYGLDEKDHGNNHSTWWAAQLAAFADLSGNKPLIEVARSQFVKLLDHQMAEDGSFPDELSRTKPYNYSLFNLEGYAALCHFASIDDDLWHYKTEDGSVQKAFQYMLPYIKDKSKWPLPADIQYFDELPIQTIGWLLAAQAYNDHEMLEAVTNLSSEKPIEEVKRNFPFWRKNLWFNLMNKEK